MLFEHHRLIRNIAHNLIITMRCSAPRTGVSSPCPSRQAIPHSPVVVSRHAHHCPHALHALPQRRAMLLGGALLLVAPPAHAVGCDPHMVHTPRAPQPRFQKELKKKKIPLEDYAVSDVDGLRFYDLLEGQGTKVVAQGDRVLVHFDCLYKSLDVVSTRAARLLAGNRVVAEVRKTFLLSGVCRHMHRHALPTHSRLALWLGGRST